MRRAVDVAKKLELTSVALGCLTGKELCAAFARTNPNTILTLQNCYNWLSGRSVPRNFSLFEDWAMVLEMGEGPHFIMSSTLEEFAESLGRTVALPQALFRPRQNETVARATSEPLRAGEAGASWASAALLRGSFLALSLSWSPAHRGRLLSGAMTFDSDSGGRVLASYRENVLGQRIVFEGSGAVDGATAQVTLRCQANAAIYLMAFHLPPLPGNLAAGIFSGNAIYDHNSEPTAGTIVFLRNHELSEDTLEATSDYRDLGTRALAAYLELLGYGEDPEQAAERELLNMLSPPGAAPLVSLPRETLGRAATVVDQRRLSAARSDGNSWQGRQG